MTRCGATHASGDECELLAGNHQDHEGGGDRFNRHGWRNDGYLPTEKEVEKAMSSNLISWLQGQEMGTDWYDRG